MFEFLSGDDSLFGNQFVQSVGPSRACNFSLTGSDFLNGDSVDHDQLTGTRFMKQRLDFDRVDILPLL